MFVGRQEFRIDPKNLGIAKLGPRNSITVFATGNRGWHMGIWAVAKALVKCNKSIQILVGWLCTQLVGVRTYEPKISQPCDFVVCVVIRKCPLLVGGFEAQCLGMAG